MNGTHSPSKQFPRKAVAIAGILLLVLVIGYTLLQVTLRSPFVISWAEHYFSQILQQPVSLQAVDLQFHAVTAQGITVPNPPGFAAGSLVTVREVSVTPAWMEIIGGKRVVKKVAITGVAIDLTKNQQGEWNYGPLLGALKKSRKGGDTAEIVIRRLEVREASVTVNGRRLGELTVKAADVATKGSMATSFALSADLPEMGRLKGTGTARLGPEPVADLTMEAPSLALAALPAPKALMVTDGTGRLALSAQLKKGVLTADFNGGVTGTNMVVRNHPVPLEASFRTSFRYDTADDTLDLGQSLLQVNRLLNVRATGRVEQLKTARRFTGHIVTDPLSIAALVAEVPIGLRPQFAPSGRLLPLQLRIAGDAIRGITAAHGRLSLRDGGIARKGAVMMRDFAAAVDLSRSGDGWQLLGKLTHGSSGADLPIRNITGSFAGKLTESFRITEFSVDDMRADVFGGEAVGHAELKPSAGVPFKAALTMQNIALQQFNRFLDDKGRFEVGDVSATAKVAGRTPTDFKATMNVEVKNAGGRSGNRQFSVRQATTVAAVDGIGGAVAGTMKIQEGTVAGKKVDVSFRYEGTREKFAIEQGKLRLANLDVQFDRIAGGLPRLRGNDTRPVPVRLDFRGVSCRQGNLGVHGLGGTVDAKVHRADGRIWVSGGAEVAGAAFHLRQQEIGTVGARLTASEKQAEVKLTGTLLGGNVSAEGRINPYRKNAPILFSGSLVQAEAVQVSTIAPASPYRATGGKMDAAFEGAYGTEGIAGTISLSGTGLSVAGGKKTLVSGAAFTVRGGVQGDTVTVQESRAWIGPEVAAHFSGEVRRAFSPDRQGVVKVTIPTTPVTALFDSFANVLPRSLQEASAAGTVAADSVLRLRGKEMQFDGNATVSRVLFDIPAQQVSVSGIQGTVPFSVVLPATQKRVPLAMQHPSRESYPGYLHFLQHGPHQGNSLAIEKIRFGPLDLGQTAIRLEAADGVIRINSFRASLAEGVLVGRGYFGPGAAGQYGGDLLVNDLSLRAFCAQIPAIKDYISGKVDGIVSVAGAGKGVVGMTAFIDLWARGTKEEKMLVSKEFLQKLAGKNLRGLFFRKDRPYDRGEISGYLEKGYLTFETLDIAHTNFFGVRDLRVSVAPVQNKISLDHLVNAVKEAAARGKGTAKEAGAAAPEAEFTWQE